MHTLTTRITSVSVRPSALPERRRTAARTTTGTTRPRSSASVVALV